MDCGFCRNPCLRRGLPRTNLLVMPTLDLGIFLIWIAVQIPFVVWVFRANPPREIRKKYSYWVRLQSVIPFMQRWKARMEPADVKIWERCRRSFIVQYSVFFGSLVLLNIYMYFRFVRYVTMK